jgi:SAM-dependent methyltransferase
VTEWFEQWFGEEYLRLYPHRDEEDAERAVTLVDRVVELEGARVLDLACGPGRHAVRLGQRGAHVLGVDLSMPLLSRARHGAPPFTKLVRGDMRYLPFCNGTFDLVVNLFTSFGYFAEDRQHVQVMQGVADALVSGGMLFMDYLNADSVRANLVAHEERTFGSRRVAIERRVSDDGKFVVKEMHLVDDGSSFVERVRLFSADDLEEIMQGVGLRVAQRFGNYAGDGLSTDAPRAILVARRS